MLSIGDLVWYKPTPREPTQKEWGVGMVIKIWKETTGTHPIYRVRWQKPENFRYPTCYAYQLVKVDSDA